MKKLKHINFLKYRWWIIGASFFLTVGFALSLTKLKVDPNLKNYFPQNMQSMVNTDQIEETFGNQDLIMMIFECDDVLDPETLKRVKSCVKEFGQIPGIRRTNSVFASNRIYGEDGVMYVEPTILRIPRNEGQKEELREVIRDNELVYKIMVSDDFRATAVVLTLEKEADEDEVFAAIHSVLEEYPGEEKVHFGGLPYLRLAINEDIVRDGLILIPIALLLMLIFLFLVFREWRGVWLPFLVVIMSALLGISLIPILGWKFTLITLLAPVLLIAVANDYGIHMIAKYQELMSSNGKYNMSEISTRITRSLWRPVVLTGLTTIAGISALWAHTMIPARQMAVVAGVGILLAVFYSLVLLPSILSLLKKPVRQMNQKTGNDKNRINVLDRFAILVVRHRRQIPLIALGITVLISMGIIFLKVDSNEENFFPEKHEVKQAATIINGKFGGSESISMMFSGDMLDPALLERMEVCRSELESQEAVDLTMSFSGVIREISKALNDQGEPLYDRIPPSREAVAQYMELYAMNGDPEELEQLVDFGYENAHLMVRINDPTREKVNGIISQMEEMQESDASISVIGGYGYIRVELANRVLTGTYWSIGIALLVIFVLLSAIFKSPSAGLLGVIPLAVSLLGLFGTMGITGIRLDVATALLSSIMIGVGVDYTIHFLWRYKEERGKGLHPEDAVKLTLTTTGRGIIFNALSVIVGFVVLVISSFTPIRFFGVLVVISIFSCLVGALVILPSLVLRFRFAFLEPGYSGRIRMKNKKTPGWRNVGLRTLRRVAMMLVIMILALVSMLAQDARQIIEKSHDAVKVSSFEAVSRLTITDSKGRQRVRKNTMASMSMDDGTEKRIIRFLSPAEVKGTGILIFDYPEKSDDMWIYLPALKKTRRIVSREKSKSFMGSEFSNANMTAPGLDDFKYSMAGEENLNGKPCYKIESIPVDTDLEDQYGYSKSVSWVDKTRYLVHRTSYYDFDGDLFKTIHNREFEKLDSRGRYMVTNMFAENYKNNRTSEMIMEQVALASTKSSYFTVAYLSDL